MLPDQFTYVTCFFYLCIIIIKLMGLTRCLEHGDADSSGSTLRTAGVVFLVVAVLIIIGGAIFTLANNVANNISNVNNPW